MPTMTRRDFMKAGVFFLSLTLTAPHFITRTADAAAQTPSIGGATSSNRQLVVIQFSGGNDGINTLAPYGDPIYYQSRPTLAIPKNEILSIDNYVGLHPSLAKMRQYFDSKHTAIIQGVGYPNPDRSHFRSMEIWQTAEPAKIITSGWLGRALDNLNADAWGPLPAVDLGDELAKALWTERTLVPVVASLDQYMFKTDMHYLADRQAQLTAFNEAYHTMGDSNTYMGLLQKVGRDAMASSAALQSIGSSYKSTVEYPANNSFAQGLKLIAQLIKADLGTRIYYIPVGGFDTHAQQKNTHAGLLKIIDAAIDAFMHDLDSAGKLDNTLIMTFSEFGRRLKENGSNGTDHGTAAPMFVMGGAVKGGLYSKYPSLQDLDSGDLKFNIDFRSVYASILKDWLGADPTAVLGNAYDDLGFIDPSAVAAKT